MAVMKVRDAIKMVEADGWYHVRTSGDHRQFKHSTKKGAVTIAGKPSATIGPKTLDSIKRQAGLK